MTREEFIKAYAERSGLSAKYASIGIMDIGDQTQVALPCACGDEMCEGWAMVGASGVPSHLNLYAPEPLRSAWLDAIKKD